MGACNYQKSSNSQHQVVLLGFQGSGKTTLFNKICNKQEKLYLKQVLVSYSQGKRFRLVDTPGFGKMKDRLENSILILAGLTAGSIKRILLVVKYDSLDIMEEQISKLCLIISSLMQQVTVIISHWDLCQKDNQVQNKKIINESLKNKYNFTSIIYSQLESTTEQICSQIDADIKSNPLGQQFGIGLFDNLNFDFELNCCKDKFSKQFNYFAEAVKEFIFSIPESSKELDEILHYLTLYIRQQAEDMLHKFELEAGKTMDDIYYYTGSVDVAYLTHIELKKSIMGTVSQLQELSQERMLLFPDHTFNHLRVCDHCGQVWFLQYMCRGVTYCGEIPYKEIINKKQYFKYLFMYSDNKITYTQTQQYDYTKVQQQVTESQRDKKIKFGCSRKICWDTMKPVDKSMKEEVMKGVFSNFLINNQENTVRQKWALNKKKMIEEAQKAIRII